MISENSIKIVTANGKINPIFVKAVKKILDQKNNYDTSFKNLTTLKNKLPALWESAYSSNLVYDENLRYFKLITFKTKEDLTFFLLKNGL